MCFQDSMRRDFPTSLLAIARIRKLEDDRDQEIRTREAAVELLTETKTKLKIATEALREIIDADDGRERIARRALARIKEVG